MEIKTKLYEKRLRKLGVFNCKKKRKTNSTEILYDTLFQMPEESKNLFFF